MKQLLLTKQSFCVLGFGCAFAWTNVAGGEPVGVNGMGEPAPRQVEMPRSAAIRSVAAVRDLEISDLTTTTTSVPSGTIRIIARVRNAGTVDVGPTQTTFSDGKAVIGSIATSRIPAGGASRIWIDCHLSARTGEHVITARTDANNSVTEINKNNNAKTIVLRVRGKDVADRE